MHEGKGKNKTKQVLPECSGFTLPCMLYLKLYIPFLLIFLLALAEGFLASMTESNTAVLVGAISNLFSI